jgi:hypothetical protein
LEDIETITQTNVVTTPGGGFTTLTEQLIASALNTPGFLFNNGGALGNSGAQSSVQDSHQIGGQGLSYFSLGRSNNDLGYGGLVLSASSESVSVLIRALQHSRTLRVLGRPQIMTLDNQPAFIQVGQRVPRITGTRFDRGTQFNSVELENTGLILGVTPRISPEGMVVMEIDAENSSLDFEAGVVVSFGPAGEPIESPAINVAVAQTTVSASSGETIVLGGLITTRKDSVRRRVPYLSDVPVLGHLFRYDSGDAVRAELLIILTPHVVMNGEDLDRIKQAEAARMNWCLSDVHEVHGPTGLYEDADTYWRGRGEVIYPDTNPHGLTPGEFQPREVPLEDLELTPRMEEIPAPTDGSESIIRPDTVDPQTRWGPTQDAMRAGYAAPVTSAVPGQSSEHAHWARSQPPPRATPPDRRYYR